MLLALLIKPVNIFYNKFMRALMLDDFLAAQLVDFRHCFMRQFHFAAALPRFCHPWMYVGVDNAFFHKFFII